MPSITHKSLTIQDVETLGTALIYVADLYPLDYLAERTFFPLIVAYLSGRFPGVQPEVGNDNGFIDFRIGGTNPAALELAVAPRIFTDANHAEQHFPGHNAKTQLYASQNKQELKKLRSIPQSRAKNRYLLLLDLAGVQNVDSLKAGYEKQLPLDSDGAAVRVVYVSRTVTKNFQVGGKKKGRKKKQAAKGSQNSA